MPLARIISHSPEGCRELAMDLIARGYAVEIVEPDKIPNNFADFELRVDTRTVGSVSAKPAVHGSMQSGSVDFDHRIPEPMPNFLRRPPSRDDLIAAGIIVGPEPKAVAEIKPQAKVAAEINTQQKAVGETMSLAASSDHGLAAVTASPRTDPGHKVVEEIKPPAPVSNHETAVANAARNLQLISKQELLPITAREQIIVPATSPEPVSVPIKETAKRLRTGITITIHRSRLTERVQKVTSSGFLRWNGAFLRASAGFAATVALGGVLLLGVRGADPLVERATANSKIDDAKATFLPQTEWHSSLAVAPKNSTSASHSTRQGAVQSSVVPTSGSAAGKSKAETSPAKDLKPEAPTMQRENPSPKTAPGGQRQTRHHHGDTVIAKDTVTYLKK